MKVAFWGCGGHAGVALDAARRQGTYEVAAFIDDNPSGARIHAGLPILAADQLGDLFVRGITGMVITVGDEAARSKIAEIAAAAGFTLCTIIHPSAVIASNVQIGEGTVVFAGAVIQPGVRVGRNAVINTCVSVDHDCLIDCGAQLAPRVVLGGNVTIGSRTFVGIGSTVVNGIRVGNDCLIGAGSVVVRDIPDRRLAYGVPARVIRER
jgi:acetyltransferase EpsM